MKELFKALLLLLLFSLVFQAFVPRVQAAQGEVLGIHILHPEELEMAKELVATGKDDSWYYMTIPFTLEDTERKEEWQTFFDNAKKQRVIPLVRLVTRFEDGSWAITNRKEITDQIAFLSSLDWPTDKKHIIVFNEVNHAAEWGGTIDPVSYAKVLDFTSRWARYQDENYVVLPAAMDLAAPNGPKTMEAFNYLDQMLAYNPGVFDYIDAWNSHSYPNPGFSSSPQRTEKNSLRGFEHELAYLKEKIGRDDYQVYITETGWVANTVTTPWLESYYTYSLQHIWSHPQVVAVTPFVLRGDPGPFANFAFLDRENKPTKHYLALRRAIENAANEDI